MICCPLLMNICQARAAGAADGGAAGWRAASAGASQDCGVKSSCCRRRRVLRCAAGRTCHALLGTSAKLTWRAGPCASFTCRPLPLPLPLFSSPQVLIQDLVLKWRSAKGAGADNIDGGPTLAERIRSFASATRSPGRLPGLASVGERMASLAKLGGSRPNVAEREASLLGAADQRSDAPV